MDELLKIRIELDEAITYAQHPMDRSLAVVNFVQKGMGRLNSNTVSYEFAFKGTK